MHNSRRPLGGIQRHGHGRSDREFRGIYKKHDKHSDTTLQSDLVQEVHNRNFFKSQRFGQLIMDIEKLATQIMSRLTGDLESNEPLRPAGVYDCDNLCPTCLEQLCNPILVLIFLALLVPKYEY